MPAGVNLSTYVKFFVASMLSMMAGSQTIHIIYHPLDDLDVLVQKQIEILKKASSTPSDEMKKKINS
jgi:hypothetical protein